MTLDLLRAAWRWRPIPNCPGRFVMESGPTNLAPRDLVGPDVPVQEFRVPAARDVVMVARLADGGLISYKRRNGTYVHTLNSTDGFERKVAQLSIILGRRP